MTHGFPDDYWRGKIFGVTDEMRDWRRHGLDQWLRELVINPKFMLDDSNQCILYDFLEVPLHLSHLNDPNKKDDGRDETPEYLQGYARAASLEGCQPFWK
jgi:hypothetical protein